MTAPSKISSARASTTLRLMQENDDPVASRQTLWAPFVCVQHYRSCGPLTKRKQVHKCKQRKGVWMSNGTTHCYPCLAIEGMRYSNRCAQIHSKFCHYKSHHTPRWTTWERRGTGQRWSTVRSGFDGLDKLYRSGHLLWSARA